MRASAPLCLYRARSRRPPLVLSSPARTCDNERLDSYTFVTMNSTAASANAEPLRKYMCVVCGFIYDEADGLPEEGIDPGTRWDDIPDTWTCPDCGVTKEDFEMIEFD